jgi:hypothetical protein
MKRRSDGSQRVPAAGAPAELALHLPISVGPMSAVIHDTHAYSTPPEAAR